MSSPEHGHVVIGKEKVGSTSHAAIPLDLVVVPGLVTVSQIVESRIGNVITAEVLPDIIIGPDGQRLTVPEGIALQIVHSCALEEISPREKVLRSTPALRCHQAFQNDINAELLLNAL